MPADSEVTFDDGSVLDFEYDSGLALSGVFGMQINESLRFEPEISYQENDIDTATIKVGGSGSTAVNGDATSLSFMANLYFDFTNNSSVTPFVGGGLGLAKVEVSNLTFAAAPGFYLEGDDDTVLAYQFSTGIAFSTSDLTTIDLMYRYFTIEDADFEISEAEFASHNFFIGFRQAF